MQRKANSSSEDLRVINGLGGLISLQEGVVLRAGVQALRPYTG